jgi:Flp pilus assembly protein TadG
VKNIKRVLKLEKVIALRLNNRGQALVEFVIILPIIIMILFVVIDFAFVFYNKNSLEGVMDEVSSYQQSGKSYDEINEILDSDTTMKYNYQGDKLEIVLTKKVNLITPFASSFFENPYKITTKRVLFNE